MAFWQLALVASALILLGLNVGAVFNSNLPGGGEQADDVRTYRRTDSSSIFGGGFSTLSSSWGDVEGKSTAVKYATAVASLL